jgi:hypothetical protein
VLRYLISILLLAGTQAAAPQPKFPSAVDVVVPNVEYGRHIDSLRHVDFRDFDLVIVDGKRHEHFLLTNGEYREREDLGGTEVSLGTVQFFGAKGSRPNYVLLTIEKLDWGGSSSNTGIVQLLIHQYDRLRIVQQFTFDLQAPGTGSIFDVKSGSLVIKARSNDESAHCCRQHIDIVHFQWTGQSITQQATATVAISAAKR